MKLAVCTKWLTLILAALGATSARAAILVSSGSYSVQAGTPVTVQLLVSDSSAPALSDIEGMTLTVQIADGGGSAPKITSVDLLSGTIWSGHASAADVLTPVGGNLPQYQSRDVLTDLAGDHVNANGLLATVSIDTTGVSPGSYDIKLVGTKTAGNDSALSSGLGDPVAASFANGILAVVVPEPGGLALLGLAAALSLIRRCRNGMASHLSIKRGRLSRQTA